MATAAQIGRESTSPRLRGRLHGMASGHRAIPSSEPRMIDLSTILFSTAVCVFVLVRAVGLDRSLPWFGVKNQAEPSRKHRPPRRGRKASRSGHTSTLPLKFLDR